MLSSFQSQAIGTAAYNLPWYNIKNYRTRRFLLLIIIRSQRSANISVGKFYPVNLESYFDALSSAYSYCTVLLKVM